ncbi:hypothetical protein ALP65_04668, partial [Pseudomonas aeruginosa]
MRVRLPDGTGRTSHGHRRFPGGAGCGREFPWHSLDDPLDRVGVGGGVRRGAASGAHRHADQGAEEGDRQPLQFRVGHRQLEVGEAREQALDGDPPLQPGQRGADAVVHAEAVAEMAIGVAGEVEAVGIVEALGVVVGGQVGDQDVFAGGNGDPVQFYVFHGEAQHRGAHRAVVADQFFHGVGQEFRLRPQQRQLLRVDQQGDQRVADHVHGGLEAAHHQQVGHGDEFRLAQLAALVGGLHQPAVDVVGRLPALGLEQHAQVVDLRIGQGLGLLRRQQFRLALPGLAGVFALSLGNAQQLEDHRDGQRDREVGHQVGLFAAGHGVQQCLGDPFYMRLQALHLARGERAANQRAQAGMVRRVEVEHVVAESLADPRARAA